MRFTMRLGLFPAHVLYYIMHMDYFVIRYYSGGNPSHEEGFNILKNSIVQLTFLQQTNMNGLL